MEMSRPLGVYGDFYWLMYLLSAGALAIFTFGVRARVRRWRVGEGRLGDRLDRPWRRLRDLAVDLATPRRFRRRGKPWLFHSLMVWGFALFLLATFCVLLQERFGLSTFAGGWYLLLSLALDLFSILFLAGVMFAAWRRWAVRPAELGGGAEDGAVLAVLALLPTTGLILEAVRMAKDPDPWGAWSPAGAWLAGGFSGLAPATLDSLHRGLWWGHLALSLGFVAAIPYGRLFHLIAGPLSLFFADRHRARSLAPLDFTDEAAERFGAERVGDLHWKSLVETDACLDCGRCQSDCPAWEIGEPLSPLQIGQGVRRCLDRETSLGRRAAASLHEQISEEALWACSTCGACERACPVAVEHVPRLVALRRYRVLSESRFPAELQTTFRNLERSGNPWGMPARERGERATAAGWPLTAETPPAEVLLWTGCAGVFDPRYRQVTAALAKLLDLAGISYVVPGDEAVCCGDGARRLGNEYLFQDLVAKNMTFFEKIGVRQVVTACPHCFNCLQHEYPQFGGDLTVTHHSEFLADLLAAGRLPAADGAEKSTIGFHDPCYLARYNGISAAPRRVLAALGSDLYEPARTGPDAFCCGGGGGRMWLEEKEGRSMGKQRVRQFLDGGARRIATACPFCLTMLSEGVRRNAEAEDVRVLDLAELMVENMTRPDRR